MINPKFHLQSPKDAIDGDFPILMLFSVNGKRLQYYTGIRQPKKFFTKLGKYPFTNKWQDAPGTKIKLDALLRHVFSIESDLIKNGNEQTVDVYRDELDKRFKGREEQVIKGITIEDVIVEFLKHKKTVHSHNTFRNNQTSVNMFRDFLGKKATTLGISDITEAMIVEFRYSIQEGRLNNTVVKTLQVLRTFLKYCVKHKYITTSPLTETGSPNDITVIHLSYDEVMKIAYTPMPSLSLERVRDFFLFGCFTGMRYGDIAGLKKSTVHSDHIKFFNQKNGTTQTLTVPLTPVSKAIIDKYKDTPGAYAIPCISNQKMNDFLKIVGEHAGLDDTVVIAEKNASGVIRNIEYKMHELLTCHVTRKSFITIALRLGMQESVVKSITGHAKNSKAFHKYYDVVNETKFEQMAQIFNK
jgi:integrase